MLCEPDRTAELREQLGGGVVDLTSAMGALTIAGPLAPEVFARFTAIDLRPQVHAGARLPAGLGGAHARARSCARPRIAG